MRDKLRLSCAKLRLAQVYKLKLGGAIQKSTILVGQAAGWPCGRAGGRVGEMESKAISASNLKWKLKLTEAELGKKLYILIEFFFLIW